MSLFITFISVIAIFLLIIFLKAVKYIWIILLVMIFIIIKKKLKNNRGRNRCNNGNNSFSNNDSSFRNTWSNHFKSNNNNKRWNDNSDDINMKKNESKIDREKQILLLAVRFNNKLTVSDVVMNSKLSSVEVEKIMKLFVDNFIVESKMSEKGIIVYIFPELLTDINTVKIPYNNVKEFEKEIFKLALRNGKRLSLSSIILKTSLTIKDAVKYMKDLCDRGIAIKTQTVHDAIIYEFPGILSENEKENAKGMWE